MAKFNYGRERKKLLESSKQYNLIMKQHGVHDDVINEINDFDLMLFNKYRSFKRNETVTDSIFFELFPANDTIDDDVISQLSVHPDFDLFIKFISIYPKKKKIVYLLNDSISIKEIARTLGMSEAAVYKQIERMPSQFQQFKNRLNKK